jgi:hypothetical protein
MFFVIMQGIPRAFSRQSGKNTLKDRKTAQAAVQKNSAYYYRRFYLSLVAKARRIAGFFAFRTLLSLPLWRSRRLTAG